MSRDLDGNPYPFIQGMQHRPSLFRGCGSTSTSNKKSWTVHPPLHWGWVVCTGGRGFHFPKATLSACCGHPGGALSALGQRDALKPGARLHWSVCLATAQGFLSAYLQATIFISGPQSWVVSSASPHHNIGEEVRRPPPPRQGPALY